MEFHGGEPKRFHKHGCLESCVCVGVIKKKHWRMKKGLFWSFFESCEEPMLFLIPAPIERGVSSHFFVSEREKESERERSEHESDIPCQGAVNELVIIISL